MKPVFHPFFGKQNELRKLIKDQGREITGKTEHIHVLETQLTASQEQVKHMMEQHDEVIVNKNQQIIDLTAEQKQLQEVHTTLTAQYSKLLINYDKLEAERDTLQAKLSHKKRPAKEQINHSAQG